MYVKDRLRSQGEKKIKYSLMQKGISEELIYRELDKISNDDLEDTAYNLALKKYLNYYGIKEQLFMLKI